MCSLCLYYALRLKPSTRATISSCPVFVFVDFIYYLPLIRKVKFSPNQPFNHPSSKPLLKSYILYTLYIADDEIYVGKNYPPLNPNPDSSQTRKLSSTRGREYLKLMRFTHVICVGFCCCCVLHECWLFSSKMASLFSYITWGCHRCTRVVALDTVLYGRVCAVTAVVPRML